LAVEQTGTKEREMSSNDMLASLLIGLGSSALVSAAAAYLGVRIALSRVRKQTAFERRLQWCEETLRKLNEAGSAVVRAAAINDGVNQSRTWQEAVLAYRSLLPYSDQKELYANEKALKAIQLAVDTMAALLKRRAEQADDCEIESAACVDKLQSAVKELTVEARKHLGFERLPEGALAAKMRFKGYVPPDLLDAS
jgi:hypothetical protein